MRRLHESVAECLPDRPTGHTDNLDGLVTTMWNEHEYKCPVSCNHTITGSTRRMYCAVCGIYWDRSKLDD